jgi:hypothetical protein
MGNEFILTDADKPVPGASLAEDILDLRLLTAGDTLTGPIDYVHGELPEDP